MKKLILCFALIAAISVPAAFSQLRFELGANVPVKGLMLSGNDFDLGDLSIQGTVDLTGENIFFAIPNSSLLLQANLGFLKIGAGVKIQSFMLMAYGAYPNAQVELTLGPLCIDASLGGYYFGLFAIGIDPILTDSDYLIPEASVWVALGKKKAFRIGAGAICLLRTDFDISDLPVILYGGMKIVLE